VEKFGKVGVGDGNYGKVGVGVGYFTSDSVTLQTTTALLERNVYKFDVPVKSVVDVRENYLRILSSAM